MLRALGILLSCDVGIMVARSAESQGGKRDWMDAKTRRAVDHNPDSRTFWQPCVSNVVRSPSNCSISRLPIPPRPPRNPLVKRKQYIPRQEILRRKVSRHTQNGRRTHEVPPSRPHLSTQTSPPPQPGHLPLPARIHHHHMAESQGGATPR
jgi:hypothetical protein